jgi:hypothetical protein
MPEWKTLVRQWDDYTNGTREMDQDLIRFLHLGGRDPSEINEAELADMYRKADEIYYYADTDYNEVLDFLEFIEFFI